MTPNLHTTAAPGLRAVIRPDSVELHDGDRVLIEVDVDRPLGDREAREALREALAGLAARLPLRREA